LFCPRDGAPLTARRQEPGRDPHVGLTIDGGLRIERLVGIGTMGRVYRAWQSGTERPVAIKILHREHAKNPTLVARFHREGRVAGGLVHPNVVSVFAAGSLPHGAETDGEPYLAMEFLDGLTLRSAFAAVEGALSLTRALRILLQIADAIGEAHVRDIVHRDLKPENVMLVPVGADPEFVKVLDFGVARVGEADSSLATHAGAVLGTAVYACPESARGERVGPPGDVYSMATLLFECLAGRTPFQGKSPVDVLIQHAQAVVPDLRTLARCAVPEPLAAVVARALSKNPRDRYRDGRDFGRALLDAARASGVDDEVLTGRVTLTGAGRAPEHAQSTTLVATSSPHPLPAGVARGVS
jgi:serine/threonine-protein kinase